MFFWQQPSSFTPPLAGDIHSVCKMKSAARVQVQANGFGSPPQHPRGSTISCGYQAWFSISAFVCLLIYQLATELGELDRPIMWEEFCWSNVGRASDGYRVYKFASNRLFSAKTRRQSLGSCEDFAVAAARPRPLATCLMAGLRLGLGWLEFCSLILFLDIVPGFGIEWTNE